MRKINNQGASTFSAIVVVVIVLILLGIVAYVVIRNGRIATPNDTSTTSIVEKVTDEEEGSEISDSDEVEVLEKELDETNEGSFDSDFEALDEEAASL